MKNAVETLDNIVIIKRRRPVLRKLVQICVLIKDMTFKRLDMKLSKEDIHITHSTQRWRRRDAASND
jgi:hypothetical protein